MAGLNEFRARGTFYVSTNEEAPFACGLCALNVGE